MTIDDDTLALPPEVWAELTAPARVPGLTPAGAAMLRRLRSHPAAPVYRNFSGHRLSTWDRRWARLRNAWLRHAPTQAHAGDGGVPAWV